MKRDARIGLAVVLVLGLLVTLLVGRAIYNHAAPAESEGELAANGAVPATGDAKVASAALQGAVPVPLNAGAPGQSTTGATSPAVQKFVDDQTRTIAQDTAGAPVAANGAVTKGDLTPDQAAALDHEGGPSPMARNAALDVPASPCFAYTLATGDNLWKISSKVYGDGKFTQKIIEANPGLNTQKMHVGSVIKIPSVPNKTILMKLPPFAESGKSGKKTSDPSSADTRDTAPVPSVEDKPAEKAAADAKGTTHKVATGETLSSIAKKYYGSSSAKNVEKIISANRGLNASKLRVGQELTIP